MAESLLSLLVTMLWVASSAHQTAPTSLDNSNSRLKVELPGCNDRCKIMRKILDEQEIQTAEDVDLNLWAKLTATYSYPELKNLCEMASSVRLEGLVENQAYSPTELAQVTKADFVKACQKVEMGCKTKGKSEKSIYEGGC